MADNSTNTPGADSLRRGPMKRRMFITCLVGTAAIGWSVLKLKGTRSAHVPGGALPGTSGTRKLFKITRTTRALGTGVSLTVLHSDRAAAEEAIADAFRELGRVEDIMSLYRPESQLCQLNREGLLDHPHPYLIEVLQSARNLSEVTDGAFDVTVQPLWQLYDENARAGTLPTQEAIRNALATVDWRRVEIGRDQVRINGSGTRITLNGIAQGYAADTVKRVLGEHGIRSALIDTGEIDAIGQTSGDRDWTIGIKHPRKMGEFLSLAALQNRALATSGDYETKFSDDYRLNHLLDPKTGRSPDELSSVSIAAPTALQADALSTAVFILGMAEGRRLVESTPGTDALFVTKLGQVERTAGFPIVG
ncbi:MAG: FAD:protein FMN transferase [Opitutaceae bacterium]